MAGSKQHAFPPNVNRNLPKANLGGVVFGCNNGTMGECLSKQLFGLPGAHFSYVKNIHPGLPLFLFNYTDRKLYGIFEAVSPGKMNIDPYAWTLNGYEKTKYPAQVQVRMRQQCQPLAEAQFKPLIQENYYTPIRFCFELDHGQIARLMSNMSAMITAPGLSAPRGNVRWAPVSDSQPPSSKREVIGASGPPAAVGYNLANIQECGSQQLQEPSLDHQEADREVQDIIYQQLKELAKVNLEDSEASKGGCVQEISTSSEGNSGKASLATEISRNVSDNNPVYSSCNHGGIIVQLVDKMRELCAFRDEQVQMYYHLQQKLLQGENEIKQLKSRVTVLESKSNGSMVIENETLESSGSLLQGENEIKQLKSRVTVLESKSNGSMVIENETLESSGSLLQGEKEIKQLKGRVTVLESKSNGSMDNENETLESSGSLVIDNDILESNGSMMIKNGTLDSIGSVVIENGTEPEIQDDNDLHLDFGDSIFLVGGYDGSSWLSRLNLYSPSRDVLKCLKPMSCVRSHTAVVESVGELYVFGGGNGSDGYDTVESYNLAHDIWSPQPSLNEKKYHLAGAALDSKIFAMGGNDGNESLSCVEMYDINIGRWIKSRSMLEKRSALCAVELNGAVYAVGGYGNCYLQSAERLDPREHSWCKIEGMCTPRGGHSLVVMNEKLYAVGGYDGTEMTSSVEIYDPRLGIWLNGEPMNQVRGNAAAAVLNNSIYVIGGAPTEIDMTSTVECYVEGQGWELVRNFNGPGRRCFTSAIVVAGDSK